MKVLLISTRAKLTADWVRAEIAPLREHDPEISIVVLTRPAEPLPVATCVVLGRSLRPRRRVGVVGSRPFRRTRADRLLARVVPDRWAKDRSLQAASGARWSPEVRGLFRSADVVVATDHDATWAAWQLARRIPGPHVVQGVAGAVRRLSESAARR